MAVKPGFDTAASKDLPPPPAPTASDANPWEMPEQYGTRGKRSKGPLRPAGRGRIQLPGQRGPEHRPDARDPVKRRKRRLIPIAIIAAFFGVAITVAREAAAEGDLVAAIVPLVVFGIVLIGAMRSRKSDSTRPPPGSD